MLPSGQKLKCYFGHGYSVVVFQSYYFRLIMFTQGENQRLNQISPQARRSMLECTLITCSGNASGIAIYGNIRFKC